MFFHSHGNSADNLIDLVDGLIGNGSVAPLAVITHRTADRLRIRIASRRGESTYFAVTEEKLREAFADLSVTGNMLVSYNPDNTTSSIARLIEETLAQYNPN